MNLSQRQNARTLGGRLRNRRAIILLVVLGMLALFSLLAATYIIFSARSRQASFAIGRREARSIDPKPLLDEAVGQIIRGSATNTSSLFMHSMLDDFYGNDRLIGKVINSSARDGNNQLYIPDGSFGPEVMLGSKPGTNPNTRLPREAELLKIPVQIGNLNANPVRAIPQEFSIEDALVGRYLVFNAGPLQGVPLEIVRSFGAINPPNAAIGNRNSLVVSLAPYLTTPISIGGNTELLIDWLPRNPAASPRLATAPINSMALVYDTSTVQFVGYPFHITPRVKDGRGLGWAAMPTLDTDPGDGIPPVQQYNMNVVLPPGLDTPGIPDPNTASPYNNLPLPIAFQQNFKYVIPNLNLPLTASEMDESIDVPDYRDMWLGYFPAKPSQPTGVPASVPPQAPLRVDGSQALGGLTAPSFVRPAMLYFLVNYFGQVTFHDPTIPGGFSPLPASKNLTLWTPQQRLFMLRMLQRASMRPIPVINNANGVSLSGNEYAFFTGSNPDIGGPLSQPINVAVLGSTGTAAENETFKLIRMFEQLIAGPWDVDNDADGESDSVWVDGGLGLLTLADGTLVRPMMAVRIEDLDSRVDVNVVDSVASVQASGIGFQNLARDVAMQPIYPGGGSTSNLFSGFGVGPAEIILQGYTSGGNTVPGLFRNPRAAEVIIGRYGRDGTPGIPAGNLNPALPNIFAGNDLLSVWSSFGRTGLHGNNKIRLTDNMGQDLGHGPFPASQFGFPMDMFGRSMVALDLFGQPFVSGNMTTSTAVGLANDNNSHPYEMLYKTPGGIDSPYSVGELEPLLRYRDWDRNSLAGRLRKFVDEELTEDERINNLGQDNYISRDTLPKAITTVSASLNTVPATPPVEYETASQNLGAPTQDQVVNYSPMTRLALNLIVNIGAGENYSDPKFESLFPIELRQGSRLNINRPLGNGFNADNLNAAISTRVPPLGNLTVDDAAELMARTDAIFNIPTFNNPFTTLGDFSPATGNLPYSAPGSGDALDPERLATSDSWPAAALDEKFQNQHSRAELARHLYVMAMLLTAKREGNDLLQYDFRTDTTSGGGNVKLKANARKLAQWAVNVVDFRDRDAIMTRFQYDWNPFDGWDEIPNEFDDRDSNNDIFPVVWGCENPELLLTENLNFHDRRVKDTALDPTGEDRESGDDDPDQIRIPQGSTFIELYCTRGPKAAGVQTDLHSTAPPELYSLVRRTYLDNDNANNNVDDQDVIPVLDLGRLAPDGNPVWRIGIAAQQLGQNPPQSPQELIQNMSPPVWDRLTFQPERSLDVNTAANPNFRFDRVIWFADQDPANVGNRLPTDSRQSTTFGTPPNADDERHVFFNRFAAPVYFDGTPQGPGGLNNRIVAGLQGGQYAVVGPRRITYVGSQAYPADTGPVDLPSYRTSQYFELNAQRDTTYNYRFRAVMPGLDNNNQLASFPITPQNNTIRDVVPILAAAKAPDNWTNAATTAPTGIGINISEPLPTNTYYREPRFRLNQAAGQPADPTGISGYATDSYINYENPTDPMNVNIADEPFDYNVNYPLGGVVETGTRENFRTMYLQRLADPTVPYDPNLNPYITVDWMAMDLTVFNGEERQDRRITDPNTMMDAPVETRDATPFGNNVRFASRSKNGIGVQPNGNNRFSPGDHVIWTYGTNPPVAAQQQSIPLYSPNFPYVLVHRNDVNGSFTAVTPYDGAQPNTGFTMGFLNESFGQRFVPGVVNAGNAMWVGATATNPFPWLGFLNRDFASPLEVLLVPASSPDRLMLEFSIPDTTPGFNPYLPKANASDADDPADRDYGHLMNYFASSVNPELAPNFYRILEFIETKDMFIQSKEMVDPLRLKNPETARELDALSIYFPPFNIVQKQPRAGRINLNTVSSPLVWRALMHLHGDLNDRVSLSMNGGGYDNDTMFWREWMLNRRGYQNTIRIDQDATVSPLDFRVPTQFRGALQQGDAAWIAPNTNTVSVPNNPLPLRQSGVESTLLRRVRDLETGSPGPFKTMFHRPDNSAPDNQTHRNAFYRYQTTMRMPNLITDNSNTFAVWVTIGFFEVNSTTFQLGKEYGIDQGTNVRPKAFYIIDRTIPVDFDPGQDTNSRDTILLERILE